MSRVKAYNPIYKPMTCTKHKHNIQITSPLDCFLTESMQVGLEL